MTCPALHEYVLSAAIKHLLGRVPTSLGYIESSNSCLPVMPSGTMKSWNGEKGFVRIVLMESFFVSSSGSVASENHRESTLSDRSFSELSLVR